jgi:hypothetical protein
VLLAQADRGELEWSEGRNLRIGARWAEGRNDRAAEIAAEFATAI